MTRRRIVALLFAVAVGALAMSALTAQAAYANPGYTPRCTPTVVLAVDGTKGPTTPDSIDPNSPLRQVTDKFRAAPDMQVIHVAYPGGMIAGVNGWAVDYDESVRIGKDNLRTMIGMFERLCGPSTGYVLLGYSQGAEIVGDIAAEVDADAAAEGGLANRMQVALYADPRSGVGAVSRALMPGISMAGPRPPYKTVSVMNYCTPGDMVCDPHGSLVGYAAGHSRIGG